MTKNIHPKESYIKISPENFELVLKDRKLFDIVRDDDIQVGDTIVYNEYTDNRYTGKQLSKYVKSVTRDVTGLKKGYCVINFDKPEVKRIFIDLGEGNRLVAEMNADDDYKEIFVGIEKDDGTWWQDLAIVGESYHYGEDDENYVVIPDHGEYNIKVYGNVLTEDYTEEIKVPLYIPHDTN